MSSLTGQPGRRALVTIMLAATLAVHEPTNARVALADQPHIGSIVVSASDPHVEYGIDALQEVVRSADAGKSWTPVLLPGDAQAPDPSSPGGCLPGNYDRVTFLAVNPLMPRGLYAGTEGIVGDYLDNGCGNAPGGLYFSADGITNFKALNHGLPSSIDTRGGGSAAGVRSITFDPRDASIMFVVTDGQFLVSPAGARGAQHAEPGIYRTTDGGTQWDAAFAGISFSPCQGGPCRTPGNLAVKSDQTNVLLYATDSGFYRSDNRGDSWRATALLASGTHARFITRIDPFLPTLVYVVTDAGVYRSADAGNHLSRLSASGIPPPIDIQDVTFGNQQPPNVTFVLAGGRHVTVRDADVGGGPTATALPLGHATATATPVARSSSATVVRTATPTAARAPSSTPAAIATPTANAGPSAIPTFAGTVFAAHAMWPMSGHDAGQSYADGVGSIKDDAVGRLRLRYMQGGESPQIVADDLVYTLDAAGRVTARNTSTGALVHAYQSTNVLGLAYAAPLIYFNRGTEIRIVTASTAAWAHSATNTVGNDVTMFDSFVLSGSALYTGVGPSVAGTLPFHYAYDAVTGRQLWARAGSSSSVPCVAGHSVYMSFGALGAADSYVIDARTGVVLRRLGRLGTAQWHASGSRVYASILHGTGGRLRAAIRAYDLAGTLRWIAHDIIFGAALPDAVYGVVPGAVDARSIVDGHRLWKTPVAGLQSVVAGSVALTGRLLLVQADNGRITILDRTSGHVLRVLNPPFKGTAAANMIVGSGTIFESLNRPAAKGKTGIAVLLAFGA